MAQQDKDEAKVLEQIQAGFRSAQQQLADLRRAVEQHGELAGLKAQGETLTREVDRAYRDFGQAVWSAVKKGKLELPQPLQAASRGIALVEQKQAARASSIQDLMAEGAEVAGRLRESKKAATTKTVAGRGKKG